MQMEFLTYVMNPMKAMDFARRWVQPTKRPLDAGIAVNRNNVMVSLIETMIDHFARTYALIGEEAFRMAARKFILGNLPTEATLTTYGAEFPNFLKQQPDVMRQTPYLPDVAQFDWAHHRAYYAPGQFQMNLLGLGPEEFGRLSLKLAPWAHIVQSRYPLHLLDSILQGQGASPSEFRQGHPQTFVVYRQQDQVVHQLMPDLYEAGFTALHKGIQVAQLATYFCQRNAAQVFHNFIKLIFENQLIARREEDK